jgi:alpha-D-xyloside xylohydrolase
MKFSDGQWQLLPHVHAHQATEAHTILPEGQRLIAHVPTGSIRSRGDTLNGTILTWTVSSPLEGILRVRIAHFEDARNRMPRIPLAIEGDAPVRITEGKDEVILQSGGLVARINRRPWKLSFETEDGSPLTSSEEKAAAYLKRDGEAYVREQLSLGVGENVYGLGERFTAFVKNGQTVENVNKDGGTSSEQAYKTVPFYLTNRGYGVLVNETGPVSFEVASERVTRVQFSLPGESLEYFVILGPTPREVLNRLTALTGRPALPPAWSFGLWLSTSFTTDYDEKNCSTFLDGMRDRDLPLHVFHYDCFWMKEFEWCNFQWNPGTFPDPEAMLRRLHERGLRVCVWINPYIARLSPLFDEGRDQGYLLRRKDGTVWQIDQWQPGMGIVDFTNPEACRWYTSHLRRLLAMGVDSFKTDFGERIPIDDVAWHDGSDPVGMHNLYAVLYNECVFRLLEEVRGRGDAVVFARASYASGQRFPVHWGGDCFSTFESMAESLRGGLSLGLCGFGFWSHDIGGFEGRPPVEVYKRWVAFGLLSSHSRLHGSSSYRVPWIYDEEACDVLRHFTRLKCSLMPYLYAAAIEATLTGLPMLRAMLLEFPDDPTCASIDRQYMLGTSLLVAPVFSPSGKVDYFLPEGRWTHLVTGETREGGKWYRESYDFMSLPLYVRPNTLLPVGSSHTRPDYAYHENLVVRVYELANGASATCVIPGIQGNVVARISACRSGDRLEFEWDGALPGVRFELMGMRSGVHCASAEILSSERGILIKPSGERNRLSVQIHADP